MKKIILIVMGILALTGCGGGSDDSLSTQPSVDQPPSKIYAIDTFSGEFNMLSMLVYSALYVNDKEYKIDSKKNIYVKYGQKIVFKTEALRNIATVDGISTTLSPSLENSQYLIGENAEFDGENLQYSVSNYVGMKPLHLSWTYKRIDIAGKPIQSDLNNPMHTIKRSPNAEIFATMMGVGYPAPNNLFPEGAVCWQKQSAQNSQEYIEFYPPNIMRHVSENSEIIKTGQWGNVNWTTFKADLNEPDRANVQLIIDGKIYWGFYHPLNEIFTNNVEQMRCDYMNEQAFRAVMYTFDELHKYMLEEGDGSFDWEQFYLIDNDLNASLP